MLKMKLVIVTTATLLAGCGASRTTERFEPPINPAVEPKIRTQVIQGNGKGDWAVKLDWSAFPSEANWVWYRKPKGDSSVAVEIARFTKDIRLFTDSGVECDRTYEYVLTTESLTGAKREIATVAVSTVSPLKVR